MKKNRFVQTSGRKTKLIICIAFAVLCALSVLFAVLLRKDDSKITASANENIVVENSSSFPTITQFPINYEIEIKGNFSYTQGFGGQNYGSFHTFYIPFTSTESGTPTVTTFTAYVTNSEDNNYNIVYKNYYTSVAGRPTSHGKMNKLFTFCVSDGYSNTNQDAFQLAFANITFPSGSKQANCKFAIYSGSFEDTIDKWIAFSGLDYDHYVEGYQEGYTAGETAGTQAGHETGYQEGLTEGRNEAQRGIFNGATFDVEFYKDDSHLTQFDKQEIVPEFINTGVTFNTVGTYYQSIAGQIGIPPFPTAKVTLNVLPFIYNTLIYKFYSTSPESGAIPSDVKVSTQDGTVYTLKTTTTVLPGTTAAQGLFYELYKNEQIIESLASPIVSFEWELYLYYPYLTGNTFSFSTMDNNGYIPGYNNGYNEGYNQGESTGYSKGETDGFNQGKLEGYNEGYNAGAEQAGNYTFLSLMTAVVDAPVKAFTGMLNFEILGFNMASLIIALLSVALLLKIISVFTKGG